MKPPTLTAALLLPLLLLASTTAVAAEPGFSIADTAGKHLDVQLDGKTVVRYMYAHDTSTKEVHEETYKPYLHVFDGEGKAPITKGPGGKFPHHRGIFIGWNKISYNGKSYDRWHMKGGDIVHQRFENQNADKDGATFTSITHWLDEAGKPIVEEARTTTVRRAAAPARAIIDFTSVLKAPSGDVKLDGDPEHAGIHYRPAGELNVADTVYVYPKENGDAMKDLDYPWVGLTYTLNGQRHSVVHMNHPENPKGTKYSAYRDYGRFGAFPTAEVKSGESKAFKYRFLLAEGQMPAAEVVQKNWDEFAGATTPSAVPTLTVLHAGKPKAPAKPAAK